MPFEDVRNICLTYTETGISTISPLASRPYRFIYISDANGELDQTKKPLIMGDYALVRVSVHSSTPPAPPPLFTYPPTCYPDCLIP